MADMRILLLGKTGSGKSAAGNIILGENAFEECFSPESETRNCQEHFTEVNGQRIIVIDTPGLYDTKMKKSTLKKEIECLFNFSGDGIHVILLVVKLGDRFTEEEKNTVKWIQENFGEEASKYTMVLFTHGDLLKGTIDDYLKKGTQLKSLVDQCGGRYCVFNNKNGCKNQVCELLKRMNQLKVKNKNKGYDKNTYDETQKRLTLRKYGKRIAIGAVALGAAAGAGALVAVATAGTAAVTGAAAAKVVVGSTVLGAAGGGLSVPVEDALKSSPTNKNKSE